MISSILFVGWFANAEQLIMAPIALRGSAVSCLGGERRHPVVFSLLTRWDGWTIDPWLAVAHAVTCSAYAAALARGRFVQQAHP